jgi:biopolymer transport protein ExbD
MAYSAFESEEGAPLAEINMIPLIDVMLVLLIVFIVTAPLLTHAVKVDLPRAQSATNQTPPQHVQIGVDAAGVVYWMGEAVNLAEMRDRMAAIALHDPRTELHLRADQKVAYGVVAQVMSEAVQRGLTRIGFVTDPSKN